MEQAHILMPVITLLFVGILAIIAMRYVNMSPIVGYLIAGTIIGQHGLGLIAENETTHLLAELGVVFLLFDIGLHFSLKHIWNSRRDILGFGPLQVALCAIAFGALAIMFIGVSLEIALIIGITLALSSTAVVVQTLSDNGQQNCPIGTSATAVLIFQDICAIFLLILASSLGDSTIPLGELVVGATVKGIIAFVAAMLIGRFIINPVFNVVAKTKREEIFTASALLIVLAVSTSTAMMGLSLTLGAFLAGMIISETSYRHVVQMEVKPFRGLLLGFFFITVGMSLNINVLINNWSTVLLVLSGLLIIKALVIYIVALVMRFPQRSAIQLGFLLSQGSEFAFVLLALPVMTTALGETFSSVLITAVVGSIALTPFVVLLGQKIAKKLVDKQLQENNKQKELASSKKSSVVVFGMGVVGRRVVDALIAHKIPYFAIEMDYDHFVSANRDGYRVAFGDAGDLRLMETIDMSSASSVVITIVRYDVSRDLTPVVNQRYPDLKRFISVNTEEEKNKFEALGMKAVIEHSYPKGVDIAAQVLSAHGLSGKKIKTWMQREQERLLNEADLVNSGVSVAASNT